MKSGKSIAGILFLLIITGGCGLRHTLPPVPEEIVREDLQEEAAHWADSVMAGMNAAERAAQLVMPAVYARTEESAMVQVREYAVSLKVGGLLLLQGTLQEARTIADSLSAWSAVPPFVAIDGEWGLAMRLSDAPRFPANRRISPEASENALYDYGYEMARECRSVGINMLLGPVVDVIGTDSPQGGLSYRSFGEDPERTARMAVAYARGTEDGNVISVAKHFPGHGRATSDSHRTLPVISASRGELDSIDLVPFRRYSEAGLSAVMTGHLSVPALDATGRPATVSPAMLDTLLRKELGFRGLVITDAMNMSAVGKYTAADAIRAGADIVLAPMSTAEAIRQIAGLDSVIIADRCRRVLQRKYLLLGKLPERARLDSFEREARPVRNALTRTK